MQADNWFDSLSRRENPCCLNHPGLTRRLLFFFFLWTISSGGLDKNEVLIIKRDVEGSEDAKQMEGHEQTVILSDLPKVVSSVVKYNLFWSEASSCILFELYSGVLNDRNEELHDWQR